ncbi:hypothetical protein Ae168Ps1_5808 [Pseudonocardia sp. Ae168_Ps1]|uniref:hypothetical protein n=1 Tax=unclassified Pseudonocardia TaxID=2619320 RepID=UPI00094B5F19|nr:MULTISPECIES: hypothetical protein [unclassified Pseudonocardia]OLL71305.1 hypothetical protein Ae168Ps1_5808 [Pseudonocardia sp. Ae168_Ps1]OLL77144.1 hypothetical protein Ae150APs1_5522c [Pseudonocardia sp. Ae150A_Ps1]OLL88748.1 hypothetical protein Ae263Ps1_5803 [Pseudonocardia sp. Ae263_Ps1]OLL91232.1 hypothetical protein Ae356Ps1_1129c [Pseudonocardia sp. Ae356_Ps1]
MTGVRRLALLVPAALVLVAGCGGSLATQPGSSRQATTTEAVATTPFCEAVQASRDAAQPVSGLAIGRSLGDIDRVAAEVRRANQQVSSLAPQEIRADFDRANQLVERQLELLEANGGDTMAVARDPEIAQARSDPEYQAASQRINDYVRSNCAT